MNVITVSREFGSGGRELGKRLADALGYTYYDREILTSLAEKTKLDEGYLDHVLEGGMLSSLHPVSFGHTMSYIPYMVDDTAMILSQQTQLIHTLAKKGNCVIVGRNANVILQEEAPFRIFVHADMESKVARCRSRAPQGESLTDKEYEKKIKQIDKSRARTHNMLRSYAWGDMRGYDLCVNTSGVEIKALIPTLAQYANLWFSIKETHGAK